MKHARDQSCAADAVSGRAVWRGSPKPAPARTPRTPPKPSWGAQTHSTRELVRYLASPELTALAWIADVQGARALYTSGVPLYLIGREFPVHRVIVMGIVMRVDERDYSYHYRVDDYTATIECLCRLPRRLPLMQQPVSTIGDLGERMPRPEPFKIGSLVRVIGRVFPAGSRFKIDVDRMELVSNPNRESDHHLLADRLHREIYTQRWPLTDRLNAFIAREKPLLPTPSKREPAKLPDPKELDWSDITIHNLKTYMLHYIRQCYAGDNFDAASFKDKRSLCAFVELMIIKKALNTECGTEKVFACKEFVEDEVGLVRTRVRMTIGDGSASLLSSPENPDKHPAKECEEAGPSSEYLEKRRMLRDVERTAIFMQERHTFFVEALKSMRQDGTIISLGSDGTYKLVTTRLIAEKILRILLNELDFCKVNKGTKYKMTSSNIRQKMVYDRNWSTIAQVNHFEDKPIEFLIAEKKAKWIGKNLLPI